MMNCGRVLPPLQGAWMHVQGTLQQKKQNFVLQPPPALGDLNWKAPAQQEKKMHFPAPAPSLKLDKATFKRKEYHHTLTKYCTNENITLQLQAHTEGSLINRKYMFEVFREYWANQSPAVSPPYQIEHLRLFCLWISATNDNSELANTYFAAVSHNLLMPELRPDTNRPYEWLAPHPCAIKSLAIARDDIKRTCTAAEPLKSPPILVQAFRKLEPVERAIVRLWILLGIRWSSFAEVMDHHVTYSSNKIMVSVVKDKVVTREGRRITLTCNCSGKGTADLCPICDKTTPKPDLPVSEKDMINIMKKLGAKMHSPRRTNALAAAQSMKKGKHFAFEEYMKGRGWSSLATVMCYMKDHMDYDDHQIFPISGALDYASKDSSKITLPKNKKEQEELMDTMKKEVRTKEMDEIDTMLNKEAPQATSYFKSRDKFLAEGKVHMNGNDARTIKVTPKNIYDKTAMKKVPNPQYKQPMKKQQKQAQVASSSSQPKKQKQAAPLRKKTKKK